MNQTLELPPGRERRRMDLSGAEQDHGKPGLAAPGHPGLFQLPSSTASPVSLPQSPCWVPARPFSHWMLGAGELQSGGGGETGGGDRFTFLPGISSGVEVKEKILWQWFRSTRTVKMEKAVRHQKMQTIKILSPCPADFGDGKCPASKQIQGLLPM
jgi:hypothetical protein